MSAASEPSDLQRHVSRETMDRLKVYADLLRRWNPRINLVSRNTLSELWSRHFEDSAQLNDFLPSNAASWADLGSGGGFPGAIIAILNAGNTEFKVTMIESDQRKAAFLRTVLRDCGVRGDVISKRIEDVSPLNADVISARALAPLSTLLEYADRHLAPEGTAMFLKGAHAADEVAEARKKWSFTCEAIPSKTDPSASVLKIGDIKRV